MNSPEGEALIAAGLKLEQELDQALRTFAHDQGPLLRRACQIPPEQVDLWSVIVTTMFGHVLRRMLEARGRDATERLALVLLEQFEQAGQRAATLRGSECQPAKERMH